MGVGGGDEPSRPATRPTAPATVAAATSVIATRCHPRRNHIAFALAFQAGIRFRCAAATDASAIADMPRVGASAREPPILTGFPTVYVPAFTNNDDRGAHTSGQESP